MRDGHLFDQRWGDGDDGLRRMCDEGLKLFGQMRHIEALRFDCLNRAETDFVKGYMIEQAPCVPFFTTRVA